MLCSSAPKPKAPRGVQRFMKTIRDNCCPFPLLLGYSTNKSSTPGKTETQRVTSSLWSSNRQQNICKKNLLPKYILKWVSLLCIIVVIYHKSFHQFHFWQIFVLVFGEAAIDSLWALHTQHQVAQAHTAKKGSSGDLFRSLTTQLALQQSQSPNIQDLSYLSDTQKYLKSQGYYGKK